MHEISAKLPIQPSFVPSMGSLNHLNGQTGLMSQMSKISLNQTNNFDKSREQLLATTSN
jgi:hypothetical protein